MGATGDGAPSGRSAGANGAQAHKPRLAAPGGPPGPRSGNFLKLVERTTDAFVSSDDTNVEDVRRTLLQVRQQYDTVHHEAEIKEAKWLQIRDANRTADTLHEQKSKEGDHLEESMVALDQQLADTMKRITATEESRMVYNHMLRRIQKEQAILREKMIKMETHVKRKRGDAQRTLSQYERVRADRVSGIRDLEALSEDAEAEREACKGARDAMMGELERRKEANKRRADFESWRQEVALEAANEAFNASAGRLRKLYAIEKLAGNCLQKLTFEQVERSQNTEDGFQKIREVTGLADVMDIVHKFLNRDVEHEQLKGSVKEAEVRLETLRQDFDVFKRDTEGITFDPNATGGVGGIYKDIETGERELNEAMEEHEACRARLQKITLQTEHMKRWATRVGQLLSILEEPTKVEEAKDLAGFFKKMETAVERFIGDVSSKIHDGKITRKALLQVMSKEYNEQARILNNADFLRVNCRVPAAADGPGRPSSRQGSAEDDPTTAFAEDRERCKKDTEDLTRKKKEEEERTQKKRPKA